MPKKRPDVLLSEFDAAAGEASNTGTRSAWEEALRIGAGALRTARDMDRRLGTHFAKDPIFRRRLNEVRQAVKEAAGR